MDLKYKLERANLRVRVKRIREHNQGFFPFDIDDADAEQINKYVDQHQLGYRIAYNIWKFKNKAALTMFMLRWQ
jgi:hypothetical protein